MPCRYCRYINGLHHEDCPDGDHEAEQLFEKGWDEGRGGAGRPSSDKAPYMMGFWRGVIALEEAENH
jgi:hypothetical protein